MKSTPTLMLSKFLAPAPTKSRLPLTARPSTFTPVKVARTSACAIFPEQRARSGIVGAHEQGKAARGSGRNRAYHKHAVTVDDDTVGRAKNARVRTLPECVTGPRIDHEESEIPSDVPGNEDAPLLGDNSEGAFVPPATVHAPGPQQLPRLERVRANDEVITLRCRPHPARCKHAPGVHGDGLG